MFGLNFNNELNATCVSFNVKLASMLIVGLQPLLVGLFDLCYCAFLILQESI